jgi:hypothetical protein
VTRLPNTRRPKRWVLPEPVRAVLMPALAGAIAGQVAVAGLLLSNVGGLRGLVFGSEAPWMALLLLCGGFAVTFGSAAIGVAIMTMPDQPKR